MLKITLPFAWTLDGRWGCLEVYALSQHVTSTRSRSVNIEYRVSNEFVILHS
jgi:hypothetical protein